MRFLAPDANGQPFDADATLVASLAGLPVRERIRRLLDRPAGSSCPAGTEIEALVDAFAQGLG
jgi:hypothetical protein